jgi:type 1 glutamine amidotransferase
VHGVLGQAVTALTQLAEQAGLFPVVVDDVRDLSPLQLRASGVLALFTIGETPFTPTQRAAVVESWHAGRLRVLGIHSATDACYGWPEYGALLGARFDGHPWTQEFAIDVVDPTHPATAHLGPTWEWRDEIYLSGPGGRVPQGGFPLAWCRGGEAGGEEGRTFYTALGHFPQAWESTVFLRHLAGGLAWVAERA